MCGIIGYVGRENVVPILMEGLEKLEYRGYDSAGIAVHGGDHFDVAKQKGRLSVLREALAEKPICGHLGIGHTRWATHGEPSDVNSHPHVGSRRRIAIVHNGIIENYKQIKERLEQKGIVFASQTDSEVIAQLAEQYDQGDLVDTVIRVANALEGSYALGIMSLDDPGTLVAVKKDNPLIVGVAEGGNFIASDVPAVLSHTNLVHYLDDKEIAVLTGDSVQFMSFDRETIEKPLETIAWSVDSAQKGGYPHFMLKEIMEQPRVLRDTIQSTQGEGGNAKVLDAIDITAFDKITIVACGSAYNAGFVGKHVLESLCRMPTETELASEFRYKNPIVDTSVLVIVISQSGETADTIAAMREAKARGATTLAIVNVVGSTIAKEADHVLFTLAGPEIAVATTKAFSAQLVILYALAIRFASRLGRLDAMKEKALLAELQALPENAEKLMEHIDFLQKFASESVGCKSIFFIGRYVDYAISLEGSLKLKEISYIHSEAYAGGELKHGTISLIEDGTLVVAISCCERLQGKLFSNVQQVMSRGAKVLLVGNCLEGAEGDALSCVSVPSVNELFSPSLSVIVLQLFSYYVAANKGLDIDKPRNLAKSVTVE